MVKLRQDLVSVSAEAKGMSCSLSSPFETLISRSSSELAVLQLSLKVISHLIALPISTSCLNPDIDGLVRVVDVSLTVYTAFSAQYPIGRLIRTALDNLIPQYNRRVSALHQDILQLPTQRPVSWLRLLWRALPQWGTSNVAEEITNIRAEIRALTAAFGEWLLCVKW